MHYVFSIPSYKIIIQTGSEIIPNILQGLVGVILAIPIVSIVKKGMSKVN